MCVIIATRFGNDYLGNEELYEHVYWKAFVWAFVGFESRNVLLLDMA